MASPIQPPPPGTTPSFFATSQQPVHLDPKKKRSVGKLITIILLCISLITVIAFLAVNIIKLSEANDRIADQNRQIEDKNHEIEKQRELIEKKEIFGATMKSLMDTAKTFDGALMGDIVPFESYETIAAQAWDNRWDSAGLTADNETALTYANELQAVRVAADTQASTNTTGSHYETVTDQLGQGYVTSLLDDADTICRRDVLACVKGSDPYTVHFDIADNAKDPYNDWLRTGVAYHEFAHVLQFTNPGPTDIAVESFGGDVETMADCFALTYLDGWTLDHRLRDSHGRQWRINIGYGYTCNASQRQVIVDWYGKLGFHYRSISQ